MVDPVVSSKFGKRPLLEMPALHVDSGTRVEVSSLQPRPKPEFGMSPNLIYRSDGLNQRQQTTQETLHPNPGVNIPQLSGPLPQAQGLMAPVPGSMYGPQPGQPMYQPSPYQQPLYQQPPMLPPQMVGVPPAQAGYPMQPPMQLPPVPMYPAMQNPYQGQGYYPQGAMPPPGAMPPYMQYPQPIRPHTPVPDNFRLEGVLEYGQLTTVHFRDKTTNFRGLPEFLRAELQKAYGKFPATDIRIVAVNGEFHIYASPRKGGEGDAYSDVDPGSTDARMIGFGEVVGEPRDYGVEDRWRRKTRQ